jgi:hypothetical protein
MAARRQDLPAPVRTILAWWQPRVADCLGARLRAIYLHGSTVLGDYCPGWSDVDVCVVVATPVTESEGQELGRIHDAMRDRFLRDRADGWQSGQGIEGFYIPAALVADARLELPCYTAGGSTRLWATGHPVSAFDRLILAHSGVCLHGDALAFRPPEMVDLAAQTIRDLTSFRQLDYRNASAIWLCGVQHWLARSLVFWRDGELLSKSAALQREIATGSAHAPAFALALQLRQEGSSGAGARRDELLRAFETCGLPCLDEVENVVRGRAV